MYSYISDVRDGESTCIEELSRVHLVLFEGAGIKVNSTDSPVGHTWPIPQPMYSLGSPQREKRTYADTV